MRASIHLSLIACLALPGCTAATGPTLTDEVVTALPPGNATGAAATGDYDVELYVTRCDGTCAVNLDSGRFELCELSAVQRDELELTQRDGQLDVDVASDHRMRGGIYTDGSFDVGAVARPEGIESVVRVQGSVQDGALEARWFARVRGTGGATASIDCDLEMEITGQRR